MKYGHFELLSPSLESLAATYAAHLRLIGKPIVDFLLVIIELFFTRCYGSGAASEYRLEVAVFEGVGQFGSNFRVEGDVPHQPFVHS